MTLEMEARRGEEARQLLENPILAEAFEAIEKDLEAQWKNSSARDVDGREKLWLTIKLLHKLQAQLSSVVETGKVAEATLAERALELARRTGQRLSGY